MDITEYYTVSDPQGSLKVHIIFYRSILEDASDFSYTLEIGREDVDPDPILWDNMDWIDGLYKALKKKKKKKREYKEFKKDLEAKELQSDYYIKEKAALKILKRAFKIMKNLTEND